MKTRLPVLKSVSRSAVRHLTGAKAAVKVNWHLYETIRADKAP